MSNSKVRALHKFVGDCVEQNIPNDCKVVKDKACGGNQSVPLFCKDHKSSSTEYCDVKILIVKDDEIRVIIEIDDKDYNPSQICGRFLAPALTSYYIHKSERETVEMADSVTFIHVLSTSDLAENSHKTEQWEYLESSIKEILPIGNIENYKLVYGEVNHFKDEGSSGCSELINIIGKALRD